MSERTFIYAQIGHERARQDAKWGDQSGNGPMIWATVLGEEFGEVCEAALHTEFGGPAAIGLENELIQVAAVAVAWIEALRKRTAAALHPEEGSS